jgi:hypothetical protein
MESMSMPPINLTAIASTINSDHPDVLLTLFILEGQYAVKQGTVTKFISSAAVRQAFSQIPLDSGYLPENTLRWGSNSQGDWLVLLKGAQNYSLSLISEKETLRYNIPFPSLILAGQNNRYYLWALAEPSFTRNAIACHAPFPNIGQSGQICFGNNSLPRCDAHHIEQVWQLFLESPFNGDSVQGKSRQFEDDIRKQLTVLADHPLYPVEDLVPITSGNGNALTINQVIEKTFHHAK